MAGVFVQLGIGYALGCAFAYGPFVFRQSRFGWGDWFYRDPGGKCFRMRLLLSHVSTCHFGDGPHDDEDRNNKRDERHYS